jgi:hypothetical protein
MTQDTSLTLSVELSDEEREELMRELELDEDIEKVESRTTQGVGITIGILVAEAFVALLKSDIAKQAAGKLKKVIKKVLTKAKKKGDAKPKLTLNYEDLVLNFTSTDDKKIDDNINELMDYMHN